MYRIDHVRRSLTTRIRALVARAQSDRGDSPVPSAIIIAGLVILAAAIVGWVYFLGQNFMSEAPDSLPDAPDFPG